MKLRLAEHSLRLRLSEADLQQLAATGRVAVVLALGSTPAETLTYALERTAAKELDVTYKAGAVTVQVPAALADAWLAAPENGLAATLQTAENQPLRILVEKDLDCRH